MDTKTNEELLEMYSSGENADNALQQLIKNLTPMMLSIGRKHLAKVPFYDSDDYIQEGCITLWNIIKKDVYNKNCKLSSLFYTAFDRRCTNLFRDYVLKNLIKIHETDDVYYYGYEICTLVEDEYAIQYREKHREQCRKYNEKHHLKQPTPKETPKLTEEERKERNRIRSREYYLANREKYKAAKKKWYQEHREYALQYQKAYDNGYRIGTKGPCKKR